MHTNISRVRRLATGTAATALALGTLAVAGPAVADSAPLNYTCDVSGVLFGADTPLQSDVALQATHAVDAEVPVGGSAALRSTVDVPAALAALLHDTAGARSVKGTATAQALVSGMPIEAGLKISETPVEAAGFAVVAAGSVAVPASLPVGTVLDVAAGDFAVVLTGAREDGSDSMASPYTITCGLDAEQDAALGTITVVKAGAVVKPTAKVKKKKATIKVKVSSDTTVAATGKVKITVKGKKKVTKTVAVKKSGVAKLVVKKLKKGNYKVTAAYTGDDNVEKAKKKTTFKVK